MKIDILPSAVFKHLKRPLWLLARKLGGGRLQAVVHYRDRPPDRARLAARS